MRDERVEVEAAPLGCGETSTDHVNKHYASGSRIRPAVTTLGYTSQPARQSRLRSTMAPILNVRTRGCKT